MARAVLRMLKEAQEPVPWRSSRASAEGIGEATPILTCICILRYKCTHELSIAPQQGPGLSKFSPANLTERISRPRVNGMNTESAVQRLAGRDQESVEARFPARYIRFGAFHFDLQRQDLIKNDTQLRLHDKECKVMIMLL